MKNCVSCKNSSLTEGISLFHFPKILCKKWIDFVNKPNWNPKTSDRLCSAHFHESDVCKSQRVRLKPNAVPSVDARREKESASEADQQATLHPTLQGVQPAQLPGAPYAARAPVIHLRPNYAVPSKTITVYYIIPILKSRICEH